MTLEESAGSVRVIAGEFAGRKGPARTFTPVTLWDVQLRAGATAALRLTEGHTTALLVLAGEVSPENARTAREGDLAIFSRAGSEITVKASSEARLLVLGGEPIAEPVVGQGPFVMNSRAEILQAFEDYQLGRMGTIAD